ncbi:MAG TPA: hypothetical protein VFL80_09715, partial [Thermoanaerobaculia bacterium]|nr:hypothetical protein [Thermoanaerobaculia bacterium]
MSKLWEGDLKRVSILIAIVFCAGAFTSAYAQFPIPARPNGPIESCSGCPTPRTGFDANNQPIMGNPPYPYSDPIVNFTGRFMDSTFTKDHQLPYRTARAFKSFIFPDKNRVYLHLGSTVAAYSLDTFFTRLENKSPLNSILQIYPAAARGGDWPEYQLKWDKYFYAENTSTGWYTPVVDGQERLISFDVDDRGYIYLAHSIFGWGIVLDDGTNNSGLMQSQKQLIGGAADNLTPNSIFTFKNSAGRYFALVGPTPFGTMKLYDTTDPKNPVKNPVEPASTTSAAAAGNRFATITKTGTLAVYSTDDLAMGGGPLTEINAGGPGTAYKYVTSDGTNFYAIARLSGQKYGINILTKN